MGGACGLLHPRSWHWLNFVSLAWFVLLGTQLNLPKQDLFWHTFPMHPPIEEFGQGLIANRKCHAKHDRICVQLRRNYLLRTLETVNDSNPAIDGIRFSGGPPEERCPYTSRVFIFCQVSPIQNLQFLYGR